MARNSHSFETIRSEGGLLPPDLLRRVLDPKGRIPGVEPEDYGLAKGDRLNEAITQSWNRLRRHWAGFREAAAGLPQGEPAEKLTNDKWNIPVLQELGFGMLPTGAGPEFGGRTYAIKRFFGPTAVHLVGCGVSLDKRAAGVRGAAMSNPHGLVQEFLNRAPGYLWAVLSNGLRFRILRDNQALSRQSYLEFDLEAMFDGEVYSDFVLLWLFGHATRFAVQEEGHAESCWLEQWSKLAEEQGTRALESLRDGVQEALQILGQGLVGHPKNTALREALRTGQLSLPDFHGELLRVVYRFIFLFVAEDRRLDNLPLLHPRDASDAGRVARERYAAYYSTRRLRDLASRIRGSRHGDLWRQFQLVIGALSGADNTATMRQHLALPALGSMLWNPASTAHVNAPCDGAGGTELANYDFLDALRRLAFTRQEKVLRPVDYANLGSEELGGVYESLLALTPQISGDGAAFAFAELAGNERKTSGSFFTPDCLVQCLLDSALDPVVEAATKGKTGPAAEQALLALKVCDPAVGSGHFLVGAAHRLARHLARVRAQAQGESEPSPLLYQHALRDVIAHCLYGVDIRPMSAELCRVSLWLEAIEPGKPLSFLDRHIRVGNSLLSATPDLVAGGLPDVAFNANEGDDRRVCSALMKRNREERRGEQDMLHRMVAGGRPAFEALAERSRAIDASPDDTLAAVQEKAALFGRLVVTPEYRDAQRRADAWCAAFLWAKRGDGGCEPISTDALRRMATDPGVLSVVQSAEVERLARRFRFFHWHLAFPEVFTDGGFSVVLGNPPWVRQELFLPIKNLLAVYSSFRSTADMSVFFIELSLRLLCPGGRTGLLTPNKWFRASYGSALRRHLGLSARIHLVIDFGHSRSLFPDADTFPACLVLSRESDPVPGELGFRFLRALDTDREGRLLPDLVSCKAITVRHSAVSEAGWVFNDQEVDSIMRRMREAGTELAGAIGGAPLYGLKTGFNEAFYLTDDLAQQIMRTEPSSQSFIRPFVRGRDVKRWKVCWERQWHIVIPSSQNRSWAWSSAGGEDEAESVFAGLHPVLHAHLKQFEAPLRARTDKGVFWWELRSCDYYEKFQTAKIVVSRISYHCACGLDEHGYFQNDSTVAIPSSDPFILGVLNSRVAWWFMTLSFPHKKDEALSMDADYIERFPIPAVPGELRRQIAEVCRQLVDLSGDASIGRRVALEKELSSLVWRAYGLDPAKEDILDRIPAARDPLHVLMKGAGEGSAAARAEAVAVPEPGKTPAVEAVMPGLYPAGPADDAVLGFVLQLLAGRRSMTSAELLDALILATHPDWCRTLLPSDADRRRFDRVCKSVPAELFRGLSQNIGWMAARKYLEDCGAIEVTDRARTGTIGMGVAFGSERAKMAQPYAELVALVTKACQALVREDGQLVMVDEALGGMIQAIRTMREVENALAA